MRYLVFFFMCGLMPVISISHAQEFNIIVPQQNVSANSLSGNVYYYYQTLAIEGGTTPIFTPRRIGLSFNSNERTVELIVGSLSISGSTDFVLQNNQCDGVNIPGGQFCYFDVIFLPTIEGTQTATVTIPFVNKIPNSQGLLDITIGETYLVITAGTEESTYEIQKTVINEANPDFITIEPSIKPCGKLKQTIKSKTVMLKCINKLTNTPVSGCSANVSLQAGLDNGGHDQSTHNSPRPLQFANRISTGVPITIPAGGLSLTYESPEVSGDVTLKIAGTDPDGKSLQVSNTNIKVRIPEDTIPLNNIFGFYFDLANMSHQEGIYGTQDFNDSLNNAIRDFRFQLISRGFSDVEIPLIESEGAGLPLGGVFDYQNTWLPPHCGHRNGKTIDISFDPFNKLQTTNRRKQIIKNTFLDSMNRSKLLRNPENQTHWHFVGQ